jgi:hypothetical protein
VSEVRYVHQHFDRPAKFGWFTPLEWALAATAAVVTAVWWRYLSPFGFSGTATAAVVLNTPLYVYAQLRDRRGARTLALRIRVIWSWNTAPRAGRGGGAHPRGGYAVTEPPTRTGVREQARRSANPDLATLWD